MKLPLPPPDPSRLFENLATGDIQKILAAQLDPLVKETYLHWDELRHRDPPKGLNHEQWWLGIKWARQGLLKPQGIRMYQTLNLIKCG